MHRNALWLAALMYSLMIGIVLPLTAFYGSPKGTAFNTEFIIWLGVSGWALVVGYCVWRIKKELDK